MAVSYSGDWSHLSHAEQNRRLFDTQKALLDTFLSHGAISRAQYEKSLGDLRIKMGFPENKRS